MGCVASTAKRRRKQHAMGFTHLPKRLRPKYAKSDAATSARRLARMIERQKTMQARSKKK